MPGSELLLEFSVRQNSLVEMLERLHASAVDFSRQSKESSLRRALKRFSDLQESVQEEIARFRQWSAKAALQESAAGPHLEKIGAQAQLLMQALGERFRDSDFGDWKNRLAQIAPTALRLKEELKGVDLRAAFAHAADAILIDRLEGLGRPQVVQWPRKIWHILAAVIIVSIYLFIPVPFATKMTVFGCFTGLALVCDVSRLLWPKFNAQVVKDLQKYMRQREVNHLNSMTFYALSTFLVCLIFPKATAITAVLFLGFGDSLASIVGVRWGRHRLGRRFSLEGSLTFFAVCTLISLFYPVLDPSFQGPLWLFAPLAGFIGAISERVFQKLDDNFVIPLFSAGMIQLLLSFL